MLHIHFKKLNIHFHVLHETIFMCFLSCDEYERDFRDFFLFVCIHVSLSIERKTLGHLK